MQSYNKDNNRYKLVLLIIITALSILLTSCAPPLQSCTMPDGAVYEAKIYEGTVLHVKNGDREITWDTKKNPGIIERLLELSTITATKSTLDN